MSVLVDIEKCKGCGICISLCPLQAISIVQDKAFINQNKCNECLQCINECPTSAIYQTYDKETVVTKRQDSIPYSENRAVSNTRQILWSNKQKQPALERSGMFLNGIKKMANNFFKIDSSFGRGKKGVIGGPGRHRKRYRGGRF